MDGKSDRLDAENIARAVLGKISTAVPKAKSGMVEVIRTLRVTRASAVKARTQAFNNLFGVMIGAPSPLRDELVDLTKRTLVNRCLRLRPETDDLVSFATDPERLLLAGVKMALRDLARRWKALDTEIKTLNEQIAALVCLAAPELVELFGVGIELAGQFLVTAGDNPQRIRNEAAFAKLCGVAPQPASSGRTTGRHRLSRSGDRTGQQRALHRHHRPHASPRTHPRLRPTTDQRRPQQTRDHPLPQALHRPRNLRQSPTPRNQLGRRHRSRLTNIGASNASTKPSKNGSPTRPPPKPSPTYKPSWTPSAPTTTPCAPTAHLVDAPHNRPTSPDPKQPQPAPHYTPAPTASATTASTATASSPCATTAAYTT